MEIAIIILLALVLVLCSIILVALFKGKQKGEANMTDRDKKDIKDSFSQNISLIADSMERSNEKSSKLVEDKLANMNDKIKDNNQVIKDKLSQMELNQTERLSKMEQNQANKLSQMQQTQSEKLTQMELNQGEKLNKLESNQSERLNLMDKKLRENIEDLNKHFGTLEQTQSEKLENIRVALERNIQSLSQNNEKKLSEIKDTVDEKLTKTLNDRFAQSFKLLTDELEKVTTTIGEMKKISSEVGTLSKMLSGVKTAGIFGEIQLGSIIEQILSPEQYVKNVITNKSSNDPVEFAIKMPGGEYGEVLMPIDSKFPYTIYSDMQTAYENNDFASFEEKKKRLIYTVKNMAKDIKEKYICPPYTTNFAVMFLPVEGLYAEIVKLGLVEELQNNYSVTVAGPTTMSALLNSLQMGFQTLAIQKKSNEVWNILSSVKTEFSKFNEILIAIQKRLNLANSDLDKLIGTRTRAIEKTLRNVADISIDSSPILSIQENQNAVEE